MDETWNLYASHGLYPESHRTGPCTAGTTFPKTGSVSGAHFLPGTCPTYSFEHAFHIGAIEWRHAFINQQHPAPVWMFVVHNKNSKYNKVFFLQLTSRCAEYTKTS